MILTPKALNCEGVQALMFDYIDGVLKSSDVMRLEAHLAVCEECRRELKERREMLAILGSAGEIPPASLKNSVMNKIAEVQQDKKPAFTFKPWMGGICAACAAIMILVVGRGYIGGAMEDADISLNDTGMIARIFLTGLNAPTASDKLDEAPAGEGEHLFDDVKYGYGTSGDSIIETTTDAFQALSPEATDATEDVIPSDKEPARIQKFDELLNSVQSSENAVLICRKVDLTGVIPNVTPDEVIVNESKYERYVIDFDAMVAFTGYLELVEKLKIDYRAFVPTGAQFDVCEIYLLTNGEN